MLVLSQGLDTSELLGRDVTLIGQENQYQKVLNGIVTRINHDDQVRGPDGYRSYNLTIRPWLWLATKNTHYRVFQEKTVIEIIQDVLKDYPFKVEFKTKNTYRKWGFCVQYRETDFNFISRLMEHEGLYYWFNHEEGQHTLIVVDDKSLHEKAAGFFVVPYKSEMMGHNHTEPHFYFWQNQLSFSINKFSVNDYNLNQPSLDLAAEADSKDKDKHPIPLEVYQPVGDYTEPDEGREIASKRMEIADMVRDVTSVEGNAFYLKVGSAVAVSGNPDPRHNTVYTLISIDYNFSEAPYDSSQGGQRFSIATGATLIPADKQYRPPLLTPKPTTSGPQTARVVGPKGQSIWTDEYGRIRVQFHWDRYGKNDENSSCWIRVSHPWAGGGFGGIQVPRVGEEVIVDFLGGSPDRPIVVGRLYNAENMSPLKLPEHATQSGFHTRTKDGSPGQANSILFEDNKGQEMLKLVAQKNMDLKVKNNSDHAVGGNSATNIASAYRWHYGGKVTKTVHDDATYQHENGHTLKIAGDSQNTVHQPATRQYTGPNTETTGGTEKLVVTDQPVIQHFAMGVIQKIQGLRQDNITSNKISQLGSGSKVNVDGLYSTDVPSGNMAFIAPVHKITADASLAIDTAKQYVNLIDDSLITNSNSLKLNKSSMQNRWVANERNVSVTQMQLNKAQIDSVSADQATEKSSMKMSSGQMNSSFYKNSQSKAGLRLSQANKSSSMSGTSIETANMDISSFSSSTDQYQTKNIL